MPDVGSQSLLGELLQSRTRTGLLDQLLVRGATGSVSALARKVGVSARAAGEEVRHLRRLGLVRVERVGTADVVRVNAKHPALRSLRTLLGLPALAVVDADNGLEVRRCLAGWGAPLAVDAPTRSMDLHATILAGLALAQTDGTVLRVLPTLLARRKRDIDWNELREQARAKNLRAELGVTIELASEISGDADLATHAKPLTDRRVRLFRYFPSAHNRFEADLAKTRSPAVATRWRLWMNLSVESFRSTWDRHVA